MEVISKYSAHELFSRYTKIITILNVEDPKDKLVIELLENPYSESVSSAAFKNFAQPKTDAIAMAKLHQNQATNCDSLTIEIIYSKMPSVEHAVELLAPLLLMSQDLIISYGETPADKTF